MKLKLISLLFFIAVSTGYAQYLSPCSKVKGALCDENEKVKIKTEYDEIFDPFDEQIAKVRKDDKYGIIILKNGKTIIPCKYDAIYPCYNINNTYLLKEKNTYVFYDDSLKKNVCPPFETSTIMAYTFMVDGGASYLEKGSKFVCKVNGSYGIMTYDGKVILPFKYSKVYAKLDNSEENILVCKNGKCGILDAAGNEREPFHYTDVLGFWGSYSVFKKDKKLLFVKYDLKPFDQLPNTDSLEYKELYDMNSKYGLINSDGQEIVPFKYDGMEKKDKIVIVQNNELYGFLNLKGQEMCPLKYEAIDPFYSEIGSLIQFSQNGKYGLMDSTGKEVSTERYDRISAQKDLTLVEKNNKTGFIDASGKTVIPCIYDYAYLFGEGDLAAVQMKNKWGFIDKKGNVVIPFKYTKVSYFYNGYSTVELGDKKGKIDLKGNESWE